MMKAEDVLLLARFNLLTRQGSLAIARQWGGPDLIAVAEGQFCRALDLAWQAQQEVCGSIRVGDRLTGSGLPPGGLVVVAVPVAN